MKILFVGDVMLGRLLSDVLRNKRSSYPWGDTLKIFQKADLRIINLECVISNLGSPWSESPKVFHFRSDAKNINVLKEAEIDMVSLANNHSLDYGYGAMFEMLELLDREGIARAGAGKNYEESIKPAGLNVNKLKVSMISFTDNEPVWEAYDKKAGVFYVPIDLKDERAEKLFKLIRKTKKESDILVAAAHWGPNWGYRPPPEQIPFAKKLIDSGADIIFGHSGHVARGIEIYKGKPIIYSAGDFIDDYAVDSVERNDRSFIFVIELESKKIKGLTLYPTVIRDFQARLADKKEAEIIAEKMLQLCGEFGTKCNWNSTERILKVAI